MEGLGSAVENMDTLLSKQQCRPEIWGAGVGQNLKAISNILTNENFSNFSSMLLLFFLGISIADLDVSLIAYNFCVLINSINPR